MIYFHDLLQNDGFRSLFKSALHLIPETKDMLFLPPFPPCIATDLSRNMP